MTEPHRDTSFSMTSTISVPVFFVISLLIAGGMSGFVFYFAGVGSGAGVAGFWCLFYYSIILFVFYKRNNSTVTRFWQILSIAIIAGICLSAIIAALALDSFNDFLGFSLTYLVLNVLLFVYSFSTIHVDFASRREEPLFASPWIFPIYKYDSKVGVVRTHNRPFSLFLAACLLLLLWTIALTIWLSPVR